MFCSELNGSNVTVQVTDTACSLHKIGCSQARHDNEVQASSGLPPWEGPVMIAEKRDSPPPTSPFVPKVQAVATAGPQRGGHRHCSC